MSSGETESVSERNFVQETDDDDCRLPADTLEILQEFLKEQSEKKDDIQEDWVFKTFL